MKPALYYTHTIRGETIHLPHDTIHIAIHPQRYDTYHDISKRLGLGRLHDILCFKIAEIPLFSSQINTTTIKFLNWVSYRARTWGTSHQAFFVSLGVIGWLVIALANESTVYYHV